MRVRTILKWIFEMNVSTFNALKKKIKNKKKNEINIDAWNVFSIFDFFSPFFFYYRYISGTSWKPSNDRKHVVIKDLCPLTWQSS